MKLIRAITTFGILSALFYFILPRNFEQYVDLANSLGIFAHSPRLLIILIIGSVSLIYLILFGILHIREFRDIRRNLASSPS